MAIAAEIDCTVAQLALAWCIKNKNVSSVIIGASKVSQLMENLESVSVADRMSHECMVKIDEILDNAPKLPVDRF